jgi:cation diffusion facilitator CzcD-associated flavoprotein CzcO
MLRQRMSILLTFYPEYISLSSSKCELVHEVPIKRVTASTIEFENGRTIDVDVVICATGFDTSFQYPFSVIGRNGRKLNEEWTPHPRTYLAACTDGFPNLFFSFGPHSAVGTTAILGMMEHHVQYAVMAAQKLQRERLKSIEVKREAVDDFDAVLEVSHVLCHVYLMFNLDAMHAGILQEGKLLHPLT